MKKNIGNITSLSSIKIALYIAIALTVSLILGSLSFTGTLEKDRLIDLGKKKEISQKNMLHSLYGVEYNPETDLFTVVDSPDPEVDPYHYIMMKTGSKRNDWTYLKLIADGGTPDIFFNIYFYNADMVWLGSAGMRFEIGKDEYDMPIVYDADDSIKYIRIYIGSDEGIENKMGETFRIKSATLYQRFYDIEDYIKHVLGWFFVFLCIYSVVYITKSYGAEIWSRYTQILYHAMSFRKSDGQVLPGVATVFFFIIFILMILMNIFCYQELTENSRIWMFGFAVLLYLIGVCGRKHTESLNWNTGISNAWYFLWLMVTVSDVILHKSYPYTGVIMLVFGGFVIYSWQQDFDRLISAMFRGLSLTIIPMTAYCLIYRLKKVAVYYNGPFRSSEAMGLYSLALLIAFLILLSKYIVKEKPQYIGIITNILGSLVSVLFLYMAREKYTMIAGIFAIILFLIQTIKDRNVLFLNIGKKSMTILLAVVCGVILCKGINSGVKTLPQTLERNIVYENETYTSEATEELVETMMSTYPGWEQNVNIIGENHSYEVLRKYANDLNFLGHKEYIEDDGEYIIPNNSFLYMVYRYGMFVLIPYLVFIITIVAYIIYTKSYMHVMIFLPFLIAGLGTNLETPFSTPIWLMMYIICGTVAESTYSKPEEKHEGV